MTQVQTTKQQNYPKEVLALSVPLSLLVGGVSLVAIFSPNFYINEAPNWQVQSLGQDIIDLVLIVPILITTALLTFENRTIGVLLWAGVIAYLVYTFAIYSFDVKFNRLFIAYCLTLGLSFYSFLYFMYIQLRQPAVLKVEKTAVRRVIGIYFIVIAILFYFLWLSEVVPSTIHGTTPKILLDSGLPTNPVHVLDLAIFLPGIFITGTLLLRNKKLGLIMTPVTLVFFILMDITIGSLSIMMQQKGLEGSFVITIVMVVLALFSLALLIWYLKNVESSNE